MIFTPFTGKDNHGKLVTFAAGLVCSEKTAAFCWLFKHFVNCMGAAPKMIVTDQDLGMRNAIEEVLPGTRHRWCMWHVMHKLATKVPNRLLRSDGFKKEFNDCVWSDLLEPEEFEEEWDSIMEEYNLEDTEWFIDLFEYRRYWIPAYFRDFHLGSIIRTTSISESENSFYKNFLKPSANLAEFYMKYSTALESQRNSRAKLDYDDSTNKPTLALAIPIERHAARVYTDSVFKLIQLEVMDATLRSSIVSLSSEGMLDLYTVKDKYSTTYVVKHNKSDNAYTCECKLLVRHGYPCSHLFYVFKNQGLECIPDQYCESRWMKTSLAKAVHSVFDDTLPTTSIVDERVVLSNEAITMFYGYLRRYEKEPNVLRTFIDKMKVAGDTCRSEEPGTSAPAKTTVCEEYYGMARPENVVVHPPNVVRTKGSCSDKGSRLISEREKAIKEAERPIRLCKTCHQRGYHDSRTCPERPEDEKKRKRKGKKKC